MIAPLTRQKVKKKCRYLQDIIRKSTLPRQEIEEALTDGFKFHFGEPTFKLSEDNYYPVVRFEHNGKVCDIKWGPDLIDLYIYYYRVNSFVHGSYYSGAQKDVFKIMSLTKFIYNECNPIGLELLERSAFMVV